MPDFVLDVLRRHAIIPVIREASSDRAVTVIDALRRAGFRVFEITMSVPNALELVRDLTEDSELTVGAGTVLTADDAGRAADAGARFVVSPAVLPDVAAAARRGGAATILGGLTPTEILSAHRAGADAVKIFPADAVGGAKHLKAIGSVFPDLPLIPTGGIDLENLATYLAAGAHAVGVGGALARDADPVAIEATARRYLDAAARTRAKETQ